LDFQALIYEALIFQALIFEKSFKVDAGTGIVPGSGTCHPRRSTLFKNEAVASCLLAGGARIHVDFHADRHFDDLWCLPGHFGSPCSNRTNAALPNKVVRNQNFASEIFFLKIRLFLCCNAKGIHGLLRTRAKPMMDQ
jgi:hypothetical protein